MTLGAKILAAIAGTCFALWALFLLLGVQPLAPADGVAVVYGEHEDFFADAQAFRRMGRDAFLVLHLPRARPGHQWWTVDFRDLSIARSGPPRSLRHRTFALRGDLQGARLGGEGPSGGWQWHFTDDGASFAGEGLTCRVQKRRQ